MRWFRRRSCPLVVWDYRLFVSLQEHGAIISMPIMFLRRNMSFSNM